MIKQRYWECGEIGRHDGLKIRCLVIGVRVQVPPFPFVKILENIEETIKLLKKRELEIIPTKEKLHLDTLNFDLKLEEINEFIKLNPINVRNTVVF